MKKLIPLALFPVALMGCNDNNDDIDSLRASTNIETSDITLFIAAEIHEPMTEDETDEGHTHVDVEFYGYDNDGYYYVIELQNDELLSVSANGESTEITGIPIPTEDDPFFVEYSAEIEVGAAGSELTVTLDRASSAALHNTTVILPELTPFTLTPESDTLNVNDDVIVEWAEIDNESYGLRFNYWCDVINDKPIHYGIRYPNAIDREVSSPFTFSPSAFFSPDEGLEILGCELTVRLMIYAEQDAPSTTDFAEVIIQTARMQSQTRVLNIATE